MASDDKSLQDLFASLRSSSGSRPQSSTQPASGTATRQKAGESSTSDQAANSDRTTSLLKLLKFNQSGHHQQQSQQQQSPSLHGRGVSTSDLVASYMGKPVASPRDQPTAQPPSSNSPGPSSATPQDYLLQLLNRAQYGNGSSSARSPAQQPSQENHRAASEQAKISPEPARNDSPIRVFGSQESREPTPFEPQDMPKGESVVEKETKPIFTYVNPFEQLAASSPRSGSTPAENITPLRETPPPTLAQSDRLDKRQDTSGFGRASPNHSNREEVLPSIEASSNPHTRSVRSPLGASSVLGAPTTDTATVAQALNDVSAKVSRQADHALAQAEKETKRRKARKSETEKEVEDNLQSAAIELKKDLDNGAGGALEEILPEPVAVEVKQIIDEAAEGNVDGHGSADDEGSSANAEDDFLVPVYNFILRPFVSIHLIQSHLAQISFRQKTITDIARLKKEFDQIDRTLATASSEYIVYCLPKSGGIRVIRQEDGVDRHVFKDTRDHVFNIALSTAPPGKSAYDLQTSIATATSGTVYWTAMHYDEDNIEADRIEDHCLTFPPVSAREEQHVSGGQLKTRAKRSSRHPEFFAIGRGKAIQIVFPLHAARSHLTNKKRIVNTDAYFKQRSLKINTGKAGKDFVFSEDDTVIASLDKAGRLRFWDVRELTQESYNDAPEIDPVEIRIPILTHSTAMPSEKSWPTSVLFVDKLRAYAKGTALRYVIVGMKQNHTLQLWDLGIGKAVQEVHFPHSKESDAICSVCYHPGSGIIVIGHPTRNSIYFIHLSAPKYNLPAMTQARYMTKLAERDSALPKLEATAIMSGMREYSFASKGQLRSVDLLSVSNDGPVSKEQPGLFELYVMHSKGVTMLSIGRDDLGWSEDMKVLHPMSAEDAGMIRVKEIQQPPTANVSENSSVNGDVLHMPVKPASFEKSSTALAKTADKPSATDDTDLGDGKERAPANGASSTSDKSDRRKKKKAGANTEGSASVPPPAPVAPPTYASAVSKSLSAESSGSTKATRSTSKKQHEHTGAKDASASSDSLTLDVSSEFIEKKLRQIETNVSAEFSKVLEQQMSSLYKRLSDDRRVLEAQHGANQEAVLRLVSKSLGENVENSLKSIVLQSIQKDVIPVIKTNAVSTIEKDVLNSFAKNVSNSVNNQVTSTVTRQLSSNLEEVLNKDVVTKMRAVTNEGVEKATSASDARVDRMLLDSSVQRQVDAAKIDQLTQLVERLSQTVMSMQATQEKLRAELLNLRGMPPLAAEVQARESISPSRIKTTPQQSEERSEVRAELTRIVEAMNTGDFEDATVKWLQSQHQGEIFDEYFVKIDPLYLQSCSPLVILSVAAAVTASLQNHLGQRLMWLDAVLDSIDLEDNDIREVAPKIMSVLCQRLETYYMDLSERDATEPGLKRIPRLTRKAREIASILHQ